MYVYVVTDIHTGKEVFAGVIKETVEFLGVNQDCIKSVVSTCSKNMTFRGEYKITRYDDPNIKRDKDDFVNRVVTYADRKVPVVFTVDDLNKKREHLEIGTPVEISHTVFGEDRIEWIRGIVETKSNRTFVVAVNNGNRWRSVKRESFTYADLLRGNGVRSVKMPSQALNKICNSFSAGIPTLDDIEKIKKANAKSQKGYYWTPAQFNAAVNKEVNRILEIKHCYKNCLCDSIKQFTQTVRVTVFYSIHLLYGWKANGLGRIYKKTNELLQTMASADMYGCRQLTFSDMCGELNRFGVDMDMSQCKIADQNNEALFSDGYRMYVGAVHEWLKYHNFDEAADLFKYEFEDKFHK